VSVEQPITQDRQVQLQCDDKTVCVATSHVRITSARAAELFLVEKFAIGQMFKKLQLQPMFELLEVGFGVPPASDGKTEKDSGRLGEDGDRRLWRKYKLAVPEFDCEILEEFPSRDMFIFGDSWLRDMKGEIDGASYQHVFDNARERDSALERRYRSDKSGVLLLLALFSLQFLFFYHMLTAHLRQTACL
jgi:hypothetical protein